MPTKEGEGGRGMKRKASTTGEPPPDAEGKQHNEEKPSYVTWEASRLKRYSCVEDNLVDQLSHLRNRENHIFNLRENLSQDISKVFADEDDLMEEFRGIQRQKWGLALRLNLFDQWSRELRPQIEEKEAKLKCVRAKVKLTRQAMVTSVQRKCVELRKAEVKLQEDIRCFEQEDIMSCQDDLRQSMKDLEVEREKLLCQICMVNTRNSLILPCMHFLYCGDCLQTHQRRHTTCPTCRASITALLHCKLNIE